MLRSVSTMQAALVIFGVALATIAGAWMFEYVGYAPCELCLKQRWTYYVAIPLALAVVAISRGNAKLARSGLALLAAIWAASALFGFYHSGVEWKWWPGPDTCTGTGAVSDGLPNLGSSVVMCDVPAIRIFGLSLAGWNTIISLALAFVALRGLRTHGSSSVSQ